MNSAAVYQNPALLKHRVFSVRPFFNPLTVTMALVLLGAAGYFLIDSWQRPSSFSTLYLLAVIQVAPFLLCFTRMHYNFLAFIFFNYFATYTISKYNQVVNLFQLDHFYPETVLAIQQMTYCSILIAVAYYASRHLLFHSPAHKERLQFLLLNRTQLFVVGAYVILVPVLVGVLPPAMIALYFAAASADMVLMLCSESPDNRKLAAYIRWIAYISTVFYFVRTGFLSMMGNLATYLFISGCLQRNWRRIVVPLLLMVLGSALQTVKGSYRHGLKENPNLDSVEKMNYLGALLYTQYVENVNPHEILGLEVEEAEETELKDEDKAGLLHGFARLGDDSLERVLAWTPEKVPYWGGETYSALPYMFIPRLLWPDKPSRHIWNKFGRVYGYLSVDDFETSVGVSYLAEAYMNFGYTGLYWVAIFVGFFIALVERVSVYFLGGYFYFTYICFLMPLMQSSSDLSSMLMSVVIISGVLFLFRTQFVKMARKDEYS